MTELLHKDLCLILGVQGVVAHLLNQYTCYFILLLNYNSKKYTLFTSPHSSDSFSRLLHCTLHIHIKHFIKYIVYLWIKKLKFATP